MKLEPFLHSLLTDWLENRPVLYPARYSGTLPAGFKPGHLDCYGTSRAVYAHAGLTVIAGITMLEKSAKLFPWPHMVNALGERLVDGLVDASPSPDQRNLGFIPIHVTETNAWNAITAAYQSASQACANGPSWGCANADDLTVRYLRRLQNQADCAHWIAQEVAVPNSIPKAS